MINSDNAILFESQEFAQEKKLNSLIIAAVLFHEKKSISTAKGSASFVARMEDINTGSLKAQLLSAFLLKNKEIKIFPVLSCPSMTLPMKSCPKSITENNVVLQFIDKVHYFPL